MPSRRRPCTQPRRAVLSRVVELLDQAIDTDGGDRSMLVRIRRPGTDIELGLRPLDPGEHPASALLGFRAADDWDAIGVIGCALAHDVDGTRAPIAVRVIHVVDRSGAAASRLRHLDNSDQPTPVGEPGGFLDDCCRRALDLPTPPPPAGPEIWWAACWLEQVLADALAEPGRHWCWTDLARRHPLAPAGRLPSDSLAMAGHIRAAASSGSWERLRRAATRQPPMGDLTPAIIGWMDDGMFARWTLSRVTTPNELLEELTDLVSPNLLGALTATVRAWQPAGER